MKAVCWFGKRDIRVEQIDRVLTEFGLPVGPFGMQDIAGIDVGWRIRQFLKSIGKTRAEGFGAEVKRRILVGTYVLSHGYYDAYYLKAQQVRRLIADDFVRAYASCDVIAGPTTPTAAFACGAKTGDPVQMYLNDIFTVAANLTGMPAMSIPCGFGANGLPIGLQLQGNYFDEARLLQVAHRFQQATDWHRRIPVASEA